ncbi:1046_t:CDS:2, partial [Funneliformis mosseae]
IAVKILTCSSENIRLDEIPKDQIYRLFNAYKWPTKKQKIEVKRLPISNGLKTSFDFTKSARVQTVLIALTEIHKSLLKTISNYSYKSI